MAQNRFEEIPLRKLVNGVKLERTVDEVEIGGKHVIITQNGKRRAKIVPLTGREEVRPARTA
jgi:prevent-host-death family protein